MREMRGLLRMRRDDGSRGSRMSLFRRREQLSYYAKPAKKPTNKTKAARKVRATTRHMQEMIHAMDTNQASTKISVEIRALKDLIVALSHQVTQISSELTAT